MRQILQSGLAQRATHILHIRECCLSCRHVAVQPQISVNEFLITKRLFGSLAHKYTTSVRKSKWTHLKGEQILTHKKWMSKSSQPDSEELSLDNPRVQTYLRRLRKDHEQSEARGQDQVHLMMLLDQVRGNKTLWSMACIRSLRCFQELGGQWFPMHVHCSMMNWYSVLMCFTTKGLKINGKSS